MGSSAPRLVLNETGATCTNTIHRVWWKEPTAPKESLAVGSWTTFFALGAELLGRSYGGGVLKLEPGPAAHVPVPAVPGSERSCDRLDRLVRQGKTAEASALADQVVLRDLLGLAEPEVSALREATLELATRRKGERKVRGGNERHSEV
jgi:adenine-specific DNA-methyltransferase